MDTRDVLIWVRRIALALLGVVALIYLGGIWHYSNVIEERLLIPESVVTQPRFQVVSVDDARVILERNEETEREGVWGLSGPNGYGRISSVLAVGSNDVERAFVVLDGTFEPGDAVGIDQYAHQGDPLTALDIPFEEVRVAGEQGVNPAWVVEGRRDTWVVIVHDKGTNERRQALRMLPALREAGYPVLVASYRNDEGAASSESGRLAWGLEEWADVEAALRFAQTRGAEEFVLVGYGMGAEIAAMFLHESELAGHVVGVVFDAPALDPAALIDDGIPQVFAAGAKAIAGVRFGVAWDELDQVSRADEFDPSIPILLMHGAIDAKAPVRVSDEFATALGHVQYERLAEADHMYAWNIGPLAYESAVIRFADSVATTTPSG
jgi:pimeloyl-ACP methyl ester carboxylesterase